MIQSDNNTELSEAEIAALAVFDHTEFSAPEITMLAALDAYLAKPPKVERGTAVEAAAILGLKPRKLQAMSQRGEIPGAAKLKRQWTYDLAKLRRFVEQQEQETTCQRSAKPRPDATGATVSSGAALRSVGGSSAGRLKQMIQQSLGHVGKRAKRER